jgi:hypothetical protein
MRKELLKRSKVYLGSRSVIEVGMVEWVEWVEVGAGGSERRNVVAARNLSCLGRSEGNRSMQWSIMRANSRGKLTIAPLNKLVSSDSLIHLWWQCYGLPFVMERTGQKNALSRRLLYDICRFMESYVLQ